MLNIVFQLTFGYFVAHLYEIVIKKITGKEKFVIKGFRLHHSLYGVLFLLVGLQFDVFIYFGLGIILQHTITDGFFFITKE